MGFSYFRKRYKNVAFIYVSDDMNWGKQNLEKFSQDDIFFAGNGEVKKGGNKNDAQKTKANEELELTSKYSSLDFALLSRCNHTIGSRGTFSIWAARYAGGEIFTEFSPEYEHFLREQKRQESVKAYDGGFIVDTQGHVEL